MVGEKTISGVDKDNEEEYSIEKMEEVLNTLREIMKITDLDEEIFGNYFFLANFLYSSGMERF